MQQADSYNTLEDLRQELILEIDKSEDKELTKKHLAEELFPVGLTMYSGFNSLNSVIYNSFAQSKLDKTISLHPDQLMVIDEIRKNDGVIFSAPTSFGKTFSIFEYIAQENPKNIVLVVPTLALVSEYNSLITKKYRNKFEKYKVYRSISEEHSYDFAAFNIFILTHDRIVDQVSFTIFDKIDFLVIDEVYKLKRNESDDRVLILNLAYHHLVKVSVKHVLLAPFIGGIDNIEELAKKPSFVKSNFSPVVNQVKSYKVEDGDEHRFDQVNKILKDIGTEEKTMVYFHTVANIYKYINSHIPVREVEITGIAENFISWMKEEIHEEWYLVKSMERGFLVHNGQLSTGIRMLQLELYNEDTSFNTLLCTSTLLEGVNTTAKHVIISKAARYPDDFDAFDFYNLVGRSGRLFKHYLGIAHYIQGPDDPDFNKADAERKIEFEITGDSTDIDIQLDNMEKINANEEYQEFLTRLGITHEEYKDKIGSKYRFKTVKELYERYRQAEGGLLNELDNLLNISNRGSYHLVLAVYKIIEPSRRDRVRPNLLNKLLHQGRPKLKDVINDARNYFKNRDIDYLISTAINLKSSYIEHQFYSKANIIEYFMERNNVRQDLRDKYIEKIKRRIDFLYFNNSKIKKTLKDMGIYERDVEKITEIIGDEYRDSFALRLALLENKDDFVGISYMSRYIIDNL